MVKMMNELLLFKRCINVKVLPLSEVTQHTRMSVFGHWPSEDRTFTVQARIILFHKVVEVSVANEENMGKRYGQDMKVGVIAYAMEICI